MQGDGQEHQALLPCSSMIYHKTVAMKMSNETDRPVRQIGKGVLLESCKDAMICIYGLSCFFIYSPLSLRSFLRRALLSSRISCSRPSHHRRIVSSFSFRIFFI